MGAPLPEADDAMAKLLPFRRSNATHEPREPRLVELDDETADDVFAALSAGTARDILRRLYREPGTATDVAEAADTSLQNARYHLEKLRTAGLVEEVDTWYSSRGTEMTVYAPTNEPLVVAAGPDDQTSVLRSALGRLVGALGVLGIASLLVDRLARRSPGAFEAAAGGADGAEVGGDGGDGGDVGMLSKDATVTEEADAAAATVNQSATPSPTPMEEGTQTVVREATGTPVAMETPRPTMEPTQTATRVVEETVVATPTPEPTPTTAAADPGLIDLAGGLPPGALFFLGGLVVLGAVAAWWYLRSYRPLYG